MIDLKETENIKETIYEDLDGFETKIKINSFDWTNKSKVYERYTLGKYHVKSLFHCPNRNIYLVKLGEKVQKQYKYKVIEVEKSEYSSYCNFVGFIFKKKRKKIWKLDKQHIITSLKNLRNEVVEKESIEVIDTLLMKVFEYENKLWKTSIKQGG